MNATAHQFNGSSGERLLRKREVLAMVGLGTTSLYARIKDGQFPRAIPLSPGGRAVGWRLSSVQRYIADRIAEAEALHAGNGRHDRQ